ncbi:MAG: hypothetical protein JST68_01070 [Bacteroidetes bacterium]|nr:hypothetical protein [Bacteroidota bacterium]
MLNILAIGRDMAILQVVERLINGHEGWKATIVSTEEEAVAAFGEAKFSIVFVCAGISMDEEEGIRRRLQQLDSEVVVTRHFGGGSGLLENEILSILNSKL